MQQSVTKQIMTFVADGTKTGSRLKLFAILVSFWTLLRLILLFTVQLSHTAGTTITLVNTCITDSDIA